MTQVNLFADFFSKSPTLASIEEVYHEIISDEKLKVFTDSYRSTGNKSFKESCPTFSVACLFKNGKAQRDVIGFTGFSLVDQDHAIPGKGPLTEEEKKKMDSIKKKICADPHTVLCYITASGRGLRIIFRYEMSQTLSLEELKKFYRYAFNMGNEYYDQLLQGMVLEPHDEKCKNYTRLSGLAFDPEAFFRPDATPFTITEIYQKKTDCTKQSKEKKQMQRVDDFYKNTIAPKLAKENIVYEPQHHNEYVMRVGYWFASKRYKKSTVLKWALEKFSDYDGTQQVINSCYSTTSSDGEPSADTSKQPWATVDDIKLFLKSRAKLRFNIISQRPEYKTGQDWKNVDDRYVNTLWSELSKTYRVNVQDIYRIILSDFVPIFHPFKEYFAHLKMEWHEGDEDYIRQLSKTIQLKHSDAATTFSFETALKKWLVAMVASWLHEDVVNNVILVLIGEQGTYKSTWFYYLLPPLLRQYFYTKTNSNRMTKDDLITLTKYAIVNCEELDTMRPSELNQLKAVVTMPSIDERAAYAHYHEHLCHVASFCGTGNNAQFLSDPTGNRRWLPFEVKSILSPREHPLNYEGIYAQALALLKSGYQYWFGKEEIVAINKHNKQFEAPRIEQELVQLYFRIPLEGEHGLFMTVARAIQLIGNSIAQKLNSTFVGRAFMELGFKRVRSHNERGYLVIVRTAEEIASYQQRMAISAIEE